MPDFSVVICAYTLDRWNDLAEAVRAVWAQSLPPREVIVVIDHNPALLQRAGAELPATVMANSEARGLSGASRPGQDRGHPARPRLL